MSTRAASERLVAARGTVDAVVVDLPEGSVVLVALSGGPDSLALAGVTAWVARRRGLTARGVVVDHGLQEGSADVASAAAELGVRLGLDDVPVVTVHVDGPGGPEAAARDARYSALSEEAARVGAPAVLLGHTRDDQAETVLLRLARGSGARSLSGMRERQGLWRRPFLRMSRADVHHCAVELLEPLQASAWLDPHNTDPAYARVRARHALGVLSDDLGPAVVVGLARTADLLRDDADALDDWADREFARLVEVDDGSLAADCAELALLPRAIRTRVIRAMALRAGCPGEDVGIGQVARIDALITDWHGQGEVSLPQRVIASRACGRLCLRSTP